MNNLSVRFYEESRDYPFFLKWCEEHEVVARHPSQLPPLGYVALSGEEPVAILFAYQALGCGVAFIENFICSKEASPFVKLRASKALFEVITGALEEMDYGAIRSTVVDERMARIVERKFDYVRMGECDLMERIIGWQ